MKDSTKVRFVFFKALIKFIPELIKEKKQRKKYRKIKKAELEKLTDEKLYSAISARMMNEPCYFDAGEAIKSLAGAKRVFYILDCFDSEVQNGGLCQFFYNSSRAAVPYVGECFFTVGAGEYRDLYNGFVIRNGIDVNGLAAFRTDESDGYEKLRETSLFDEFDEKYYALYGKRPLNQIISCYIRQHLDEFCG